MTQKLEEQTLSCPLCGDHEVEISKNKKGAPFFLCNPLGACVNLNGVEAEKFLLDRIEADAEEDDEADDANEEEQEQTIEDLLDLDDESE